MDRSSKPRAYNYKMCKKTEEALCDPGLGRAKGPIHKKENIVNLNLIQISNFSFEKEPGQGMKRHPRAVRKSLQTCGSRVCKEL